MKKDFPQTTELVSKPSSPDTWWVNVEGETISEPQTLEQAKAHKPSRSRAKILLLHTSLVDEWIPVRELEALVKRYSYYSETVTLRGEDAEEEDQRIAEELAQFKKDLISEIATMKDSRGLLIEPSPVQMERMLVEVERRARRDKESEPEEIFMKVCPECFAPEALQNPDLYEEALGILDFFGIFDNPSYDMQFLYSGGSRDLCIDDVLNPPTIGQLVTVLRTFKNGWSSHSESSDACAGNRKLAKRIAKQFPELVKDTPEAQQFFNPQLRGTSSKTECNPNPLIQQLPEIAKHITETQQFSDSQLTGINCKTDYKHHPLIQQSKNADGKKVISITIGPVTLLVLIVVSIFLVSKCFS